MGKLLIITAPSGSGKSTIVKHLLQSISKTAFSVSATTRLKRPGEIDGVDYYFISVAKFKSYIRQGRFVEWEEIYPGQFSGTLKSELKRLWAARKTILFDIDVIGACDLQKMFPKDCLSIFIKPPSLEVLRQRLEARKTETPEKIALRLKRAEMELGYESKFKKIILNDDLDQAKSDALRIANKFIFG
jgi:guanylate kinase